MRNAVVPLQLFVRTAGASSQAPRIYSGIISQRLLANPSQKNPLYRPAAPSSHSILPSNNLSILRCRMYSTGPNQDQVIQSFGTPFLHFIRISSRIARIIVYTGVSIALASATLYLGSHLYVEKVALKRNSNSTDTMSNGSQLDPWGWAEELDEEAWGPPGGGTDPRLGFKARHALRSAWMATHWGGGISFSFITGMDARQGAKGHGASASMIESVTTEDVDGLPSAEQFLAVCLQLAEERGIRLPDIAALRAGLKTTHQSGADAPLDQTALVLESRMAACRERLATPTTLPLAIAGYERIYDSLAAINTTHDLVGNTERPSIDSSRLVRLATKLGNLNAGIGRREDAEAWILKAISLAGQGSHTSAVEDAILQDVSSIAEEGLDSTSSSKGWFSGWRKSVSPPLAHSQSTPETTSSESTDLPSPVTPTPALTRSLVSALLSLSGLYASPPRPGLTDPRDAIWCANLEQALQIQASALRLIRLELSRVEAQSVTPQDQASPDATSGDLSRDLHSLWLKNNEAMVNLHLAETIYALHRAKSRAVGSVGVKPSTSHEKAKSKSKHDQSIAWLLEADSTAQVVQSSFISARALSAKMPAQSNQGGREALPRLSSEDLLEQWKTDAKLRLQAERLLRSASIVRAEAKGMVDALLKKDGGR